MKGIANQITGANAGERRLFTCWRPLAARIAQFRRCQSEYDRPHQAVK
jgi:hypothetical protein